MAETLFRAATARAGLAGAFDVTSFGLAAPAGAPASIGAQKAVAELGADLSAHRSRGTNDVAPNENDFCIAMTPAQLDRLQKIFPAKSFCIAEFFPKNESENDSVPDPFGGTLEDYRVARDAIVSAFPKLIDFLKTRV